MLTRQQAADLAPVLHDAIIPHEDGFRLRLAPDVDLPLSNGGVPVTSFIEGWVPGAVLTLFQPVLVLEFRHEGGRAGFWLLDLDGRFIGNDIASLPAALLEIVRIRATPALSWLQAMHTHGMPCDRPEAVSALLDVHLDLRREVARVICTLDGSPMPSDAVLQGTPAAGEGDAMAWLDGRVITQNGHVIALGPGWRIARARTLLAPVIVLELAHEEGHVGIWYVDRNATYLGNSAVQLEGPFRSHLQAACAHLFAELWDRVILAPSLAPGPDLVWFLECDPSTRNDLLGFHLAVEPERKSHVWTLTDVLPPLMSYGVPAGGRRVLLDPDHTRALCLRFLRSELFRLVELGTMSWTSPVDGRGLVGPARTLYLDELCFAYQVHNPDPDLTFYVFGMAHFFRTFAVYFPSADLVVALDAEHMEAALPYCGAARATLLRHVVQFGPDLVQALREPHREVVQAFRGYHAIHVGHYVWQDLSGLSYLVDAFAPDRIPRCYVFDSHHHPELYGPIDEIFPELKGKVVRLEHPLGAHIGDFYRERQSVIKSTGISVPAQVGRRIIAALRRAPRWAQPVAHAAAAQAAGPVVVIGLRIGNRTIEDMQGFAERLIAMLIETLGSITIVVDGHNSAGDTPGATYASYGDTLTGGSTFLQRELEIAAFLQRRFAGSSATVINNIGRPILESVIWCSQADFFVAPWGAALAKYRWVCNTPGLTTVGLWNLQHRSDLAIYHHPGAMEDPTALVFNEPDAVIDLVEEGAGDHERSRSNYMLDEAMVFAQVRALSAEHVRPRSTAEVPEAVGA